MLPSTEIKPLHSDQVRIRSPWRSLGRALPNTLSDRSTSSNQESFVGKAVDLVAYVPSLQLSCSSRYGETYSFDVGAPYNPQHIRAKTAATILDPRLKSILLHGVY